MARGASDTLLCLDEISQADARAVDAITYMIGNGAGKARMRRDATARPVITWRVMFLSTGEKGLGDKLAEIGRRAQAGQAVRAVEIPADAGAGLGLFEDLHDYADADALVRHLRLSADALKGTAGLAFLEKLTAKLEPNVRAVIEARNLWLDQNTPPGADGQVRRVAGRFALVAAVGKLAAAFKILPWLEGEAERAASACFGAWLAQRGGTGPAEIAEGIAQVRAFLEAHGSHRFERAWERHANGERAPHRLGFRRAADDGGGWTYFILPEAWKREVCKSFDATAIARAMAERDWLAPGDGRNLSVRQRIPGEGHRRVYIVRASFLAEHAA